MTNPAPSPTDPDLPPEGVDFTVCEHGINVWCGHECGDCDEAGPAPTKPLTFAVYEDEQTTLRRWFGHDEPEPAAVEHTFLSAECGAYFGMGAHKAGICRRVAGHPSIADDGVGHSERPISTTARESAIQVAERKLVEAIAARDFAHRAYERSEGDVVGAHNALVNARKNP